MDSRVQAKQLLNHYFTLALERAGVKTSADTTAELDDIVDSIVAASVEATMKHLNDGLKASKFRGQP